MIYDMVEAELLLYVFGVEVCWYSTEVSFNSVKGDLLHADLWINNIAREMKYTNSDNLI